MTTGHNPRFKTIKVTHAAEAVAVLLELRQHFAFLFRGQRDHRWQLGPNHKIKGKGWDNTQQEKTEEKKPPEDVKDDPHGTVCPVLKDAAHGMCPISNDDPHGILRQMYTLEQRAVNHPLTALNDGIPNYWKSKSIHKKISRNLDQFLKHSEHSRDARLDYPSDAASLPAKSEQWWRNLFFAHHYGLNTLLLDWTTNPLVALYFAVEDSISKPEKGTRGAVYAIKVKGEPGILKWTPSFGPLARLVKVEAARV